MRYSFCYRVYRQYGPYLNGKVHWRHTFHKWIKADTLGQAFELLDKHVHCAHQNAPYIVRSVFNNGRCVYRLKLTDDQEYDFMTKKVVI